MHTIVQPTFQPDGIIVKRLCLGDTAIIKAQPGGCLFDQLCMLVQETQGIINFICDLNEFVKIQHAHFRFFM
jgi:hypothetical protein